MFGAATSSLVKAILDKVKIMLRTLWAKEWNQWQNRKTIELRILCQWKEEIEARAHEEKMNQDN